MHSDFDQLQTQVRQRMSEQSNCSRLVGFLRLYTIAQLQQMRQRNWTDAQICTLLREWQDEKGTTVAALLESGDHKKIETAKEIIISKLRPRK